MKTHDVAIIGSGPAGCSAAIYACRELFDVVVFEKGDFGGQITSSSEVENFPGFPHADGFSLMSTMREQAASFGARFTQGAVERIEVGPDGEFLLQVGSVSHRARAIIACLGAKPSRAGFIGETEFTGRGVSYCATCDAMFYRKKQVFVCGGGNSAAEESLFLSRFASQVTVLVRKDHMRAESSLVERLTSTSNIDIRYNTSIVSIAGNDLPYSIVLRDNTTGRESSIMSDEGSFGVFVYVGSRPETSLIEGMVSLNEAGYIITDEWMRTDIPGLFAAGDCRAGQLKQAITAASDGAIAAVSASRFLKNS